MVVTGLIRPEYVECLHVNISWERRAVSWVKYPRSLPLILRKAAIIEGSDIKRSDMIRLDF